jgi:hypothetical protein
MPKTQGFYIKMGIFCIFCAILGVFGPIFPLRVTENRQNSAKIAKNAL